MSITWLASYPKSGNTWFRVFLSNLLFERDEPVGINALHATPISSSRAFVEHAYGIDSSDLTHDEIDMLRPRVYEYIASVAKQPYFSKVHDGYYHTPAGEPLFASLATRCAIYLVRNPLDVAVSFASHSGISIDRIIERMGYEEFSLADWDVGLNNQYRQKLGSWSSHVLSWRDEPEFPRLVIRYEDLKVDPIAFFTQAVRFLNLEYGGNEIAKAIEFSRFEVLKKQEERDGFREKTQIAKQFFRKGEVGGWRRELTTAQAQAIVRDHGEVMEQLGYSTALNV